jgi:hypothetical protein
LDRKGENNERTLGRKVMMTFFRNLKAFYRLHRSLHRDLTKWIESGCKTTLISIYSTNEAGKAWGKIIQAIDKMTEENEK